MPDSRPPHGGLYPRCTYNGTLMSKDIRHPSAHRHWGRAVCSYCDGIRTPERQNARLNEDAAASLADYIESQGFVA